MKLSRLLAHAAVFALAGALCVGIAQIAVQRIETLSAAAVDLVLEEEGHPWTQVQTDGLRVILTGTAPSEAARFRAIAAAGTIVESARVEDGMEVEQSLALTAPRFSIEMLRNDDGISLIGLIPEAIDRDALITRARAIAKGAPVTDLLQSANYPVPAGWPKAVDYGMSALDRLKQSKISVAADQVDITAFADSAVLQQRLLQDLNGARPEGLLGRINISAPRPVITPFTLRFLIEDPLETSPAPMAPLVFVPPLPDFPTGNAEPAATVATEQSASDISIGTPTKTGLNLNRDDIGDTSPVRFDACSASNVQDRAVILSAASEVGAALSSPCVIGLGAPSPEWAKATASAIRALGRLGAGSITFSDTDVTLIAGSRVASTLFDTVVGELESALPDVFTLHASRAQSTTSVATSGDSGLPEFTAILTPEGQVQLRGRVRNERARVAAESFARAAFGGDRVYMATRYDDSLPQGWAIRSLAALEALTYLSQGAAIVHPDFVQIRGQATETGAKGEIARILADQLGQNQRYEISVQEVIPPKPEELLKSAEVCHREILGATAAEKITFSPGVARMEAGGAAIMDRLAEVMRTCGHIPMQIAGYTDSQGSESMNQQLSQARAEAVLNALLARRVLTSNLTAVGFGEENPIADNGTEEGREANRRIEITLILPAAAPETAPDAATETPTGSELSEADTSSEAVTDEGKTDAQAETEGDTDGDTLDGDHQGPAIDPVTGEPIEDGDAPAAETGEAATDDAAETPAADGVADGAADGAADDAAADKTSTTLAEESAQKATMPANAPLTPPRDRPTK